MTNFNFLKTTFPKIYNEAVEAELNTVIAPKYSALLCRTALEKAVVWLYENDADLTLPYDSKLATLINEHCFRNSLIQKMLQDST